MNDPVLDELRAQAAACKELNKAASMWRARAERAEDTGAPKAGETVPGCALIAGKVSLAFRVAR
jgi:hypothetical protein